MIYEVVDNAVDEALAGHSTKIEVVLNADGSCTVRDDGRGIPVDIHSEEGISAAEVVMTQLHAGGKFNQNSYKVSGGLHGVGVSVVNALSEFLDLRIWRQGAEWTMRFKNGEAEAPLKEAGKASKTGTEVVFLPSKIIFTKTDFDFATVEHRLRELAFLNSGVYFSLTDARGVEPKTSDLRYEGGLEAFVTWLDRSKVAVHSPAIALRKEENGISVDAPYNGMTVITRTLYVLPIIFRRKTAALISQDLGRPSRGHSISMRKERDQQKRKSRSGRRRYAGRLELCAFGQNARS